MLYLTCSVDVELNFRFANDYSVVCLFHKLQFRIVNGQHFPLSFVLY